MMVTAKQRADWDDQIAYLKKRQSWMNRIEYRFYVRSREVRGRNHDLTSYLAYQLKAVYDRVRGSYGE